MGGKSRHWPVNSNHERDLQGDSRGGCGRAENSCIAKMLFFSSFFFLSFSSAGYGAASGGRTPARARVDFSSSAVSTKVEGERKKKKTKTNSIVCPSAKLSR